jgi:hypothetical protein
MEEDLMDPDEASKLASGTAVWVWIVRQGEGQWCPGTVQSLTASNGGATVTVRFECHSLRRSSSSRPTIFIGISTTQMKYLERRVIRLKGTDRPQYVPPLLVSGREPDASAQNL